MSKIDFNIIGNQRVTVILIIVVTVLFSIFIISTTKLPCTDKLGPGLCMDDANIMLCELRIKTDCSISYAEICQNGNCVSDMLPDKKSVKDIVNGTRVIR